MEAEKPARNTVAASAGFSGLTVYGWLAQPLPHLLVSGNMSFSTSRPPFRQTSFPTALDFLWASFPQRRAS